MSRTILGTTKLFSGVKETHRICKKYVMHLQKIQYLLIKSWPEEVTEM
jgi:hypothetical protein